MQQTDLAYLAGLLDGEGCFYARLVNTSRGRLGNVEVRIAVQATSMAMIQKIAAIYADLGLNPSIEIGRTQKRSTRPAHKVSLHRKKDVLRLLKAILPYLVVKRPEAEMIMEWSREWGHDMRGANARRPSQEDKVVFIEQLSAAKRFA